MDKGERNASLDIKALFSCIPKDDAVGAVRRRLEQDNTIKDYTSLSIDSICDLLEFCLDTTYFVFDGEFYRQTHGAAMGSPVSPLVANIYMEQYEVKAIASAPNPPKFWDRYVDDTHTVVKDNQLEELHTHLNSVDSNIQFTVEEPGPDGGIPFLDTYCMILEDGSFKTRVYRKPTHTDLYLNWNSHHPLSAKISVVNTLFYRAEVVCSDEDTLK